MAGSPIVPVYPFATDPRPTTGATTYDDLSAALGRARAVANRAMNAMYDRPPGDDHDLALNLARAANRAVSVASARWIRNAFDTNGAYNRRPWLP